MSILRNPAAFQKQIREIVTKLEDIVTSAADLGTPLHEVESCLFRELQHVGNCCLKELLALVGNGDLGATLDNGEGQVWHRLPHPHSRRYVSIFGTFELERVAYGSREGQKIEFVPLDNRLQLPANAYSYLLQDWSQELCVESAFGQVSKTLQRMFGVKLSVDALERLNEHVAEPVAHYRHERPRPAPDSEGEVIVATSDGKGIVMRRTANEPAPPAYRSKGEKASRKRMAMVGSVYTVDRHVRTPEDVVAALFREPRAAEPAARPHAKNKRVMAALSQVDDHGQERSAIGIVHDWLMDELIERNRHACNWQRPMVFLYDGQEALWDARDRQLPATGAGILDLLHVTPRLWQAAHLIHAEGSDAAAAFVRERCLRILRGEVAGVIRGLREMGTKRGLTGAKKKTLQQICGYLDKNRTRMHYDEYLAAGYPIASGVIEGACRHLVKDRMERAGMHWTPTGAQAMLDVRSIHLDGDWDAYHHYRIDRERDRLYPYRNLVQGTLYQMAC